MAPSKRNTRGNSASGEPRAPPPRSGVKTRSTSGTAATSSLSLAPAPAPAPTPRRRGILFPLPVPQAAATSSPPPLNDGGPDPKMRPEAAAAYAKEIQGLSEYPTRLPTACIGSSRISKPALHAIQSFVFEGRELNDCLPDYNAQGGKASNGQTISKIVKAHAPTWFKDEGVVMPWRARLKNDRDRLKKLGLGEWDFPVLQPRPAVASSAGRQIAVTEEDESVDSEDEKSEDCVSEEEDSEDEVSEVEVSENEDPMDVSQDEAEYSDTARPEPFSRSATEEPEGSQIDFLDFRNRRVQDFGEEIDSSLEPHSVPPKDCLRAQVNAKQGVSKVQSPDVWETNFIAKRTTELAMYPVLRDGLPIKDLQYDASNLDKYKILRPEGITARPIKYTSKLLWELYFYAKHTNCPHVCDMVVDKFYQNLKKLERQQKGFKEMLDFDIPEILSDLPGRLHNDEDRPTLTFFGDILIAAGKFEELFATQLSVARKLFFNRHEKTAAAQCLRGAKQGAFCDRYHLHRLGGKDERCYKELASEQGPEKQIKLLYPQGVGVQYGYARENLSFSTAAHHPGNLIPKDVQERMLHIEGRKNAMLACIQDARKRDMEARLVRVGRDYDQGLLVLETYEDELRKNSEDNDRLLEPLRQTEGIIAALAEAVVQGSFQKFWSEGDAFVDLYRAVQQYVLRTKNVED